VPARISGDGDFAIYIADEGQLQKVKELLVVNTTAYCHFFKLITVAISTKLHLLKR
jgi:hypothetical protein